MVMYYEASEKLDNLIEDMNKNEKDILDKIDEAVNKPSFEEFFLNKKNKRMILKEFEKYYVEIAREAGEAMLDDEQYYPKDEDEEEIEMDPVEAYENYASSDGYSAYYAAAEYTIDHFKRKYNSNRNDKDDEEKQSALSDFLGYKTSWR